MNCHLQHHPLCQHCCTFFLAATFFREVMSCIINGKSSCHALSCHALSCHASSCHASHVMHCHVMHHQCHASSCHASSCQASHVMQLHLLQLALIQLHMSPSYAAMSCTNLHYYIFVFSYAPHLLPHLAPKFTAT